mgnify:CR=1 FL=1
MRHEMEITASFDTAVERDQALHAVTEIARQRGGTIKRTMALSLGGTKFDPNVETESGEDDVEIASPVWKAAAPKLRPGRKARAAPPADVVAVENSSPARDPEPNATAGVDGAVQESSAKVTVLVEPLAEVTWPEFVEKMNAVHARGFSIVKTLLAKYGVSKAIDLKDDAQMEKRAAVYHDAVGILSNAA